MSDRNPDAIDFAMLIGRTRRVDTRIFINFKTNVVTSGMKPGLHGNVEKTATD